MPEILFEQSSDYEEMLNRGIRLGGESRDFYIRGRVNALRRHLPSHNRIRRILDFGCGTGNTCAVLASVFPDAQVHGVDSSANALDFAAAHYAAPRISFGLPSALAAGEPFDLCYVNGVFHHIPPEERGAAVGSIRDCLVSGGRLTMYENNPWNPGARMVMNRIPFDRDAQMFSIPAAQRMMQNAGLRNAGWWTLFYFPRILRLLRFSEPALAALPLGAQYCVVAEKPAVET